MTRRNSPSPKPKSYPKTAFPFTRTVAEDERLLLVGSSCSKARMLLLRTQ